MDGSVSSSENLSGFATLVKHQATVLSLSDSWLLLPKRVWPPQTLIQPASTTSR
nr:DSBA oxidoreductase [Candidatus Pantoea persica]